MFLSLGVGRARTAGGGFKAITGNAGIESRAIGISVKKVGDGTTVLAHQAGMALNSGLRDEITAYCICFTGKRERFSF